MAHNKIVLFDVRIFPNYIYTTFSEKATQATLQYKD